MTVKDWKKAGAVLGQISSHDDYKMRHQAVSRAITNLVAEGVSPDEKARKATSEPSSPTKISRL